MVREADRVSGDPRKPPSARKNHLPVIAIPAVIALVFILYIIGWSLYASLLDYLYTPEGKDIKNPRNLEALK